MVNSFINEKSEYILNILASLFVGIDLNMFPIAKKYYDNICDLSFVKRAKNRMETFPTKTY